MYLTWFGGNSWLIELAEKRILLDPWLVGTLVFGNQPWFFQAKQLHDYEIPDAIDLILLSQGLPDHAHMPTLKVLDRKIPVIGSPNAVKTIEPLEYKDVQALEHGSTLTLGESLVIEALPGAPIGPLLTENAYILKDRINDQALYYEPHGYHSSQLQEHEPVDVALVPIINLTLPLVGSFIQGGEAALQLAQQLQPQVMIPTTVGGDIDYSGLLNTVLKSKGDIESLRSSARSQGLKTQILDPLKPGQRFDVSLKSLKLSES